MSDKPQHGGPRPGAGRPKAENPRKMLSVRISQEAHKKLEELAHHYNYSKGRVIEKVLREMPLRD